MNLRSAAWLFLSIWLGGMGLFFGGYIAGYNDGEWNACIRNLGRVCDR